MVTVPVTFDATFDYAPAFAGMISDAMFTDKIIVPCGATAQPFGTVVGYVEATGVSELPVVATRIAGIAIHEHQTGSRRTASTGYVQYEAMSVMRRGRIWALANGACTKGAVAKFTLASGIFSDAGAATMPTAKFLSAALTVPAIWPGEPTHQIVLVEMHSPQVDNIGAS
jgi:hypothetical protein